MQTIVNIAIFLGFTIAWFGTAALVMYIVLDRLQRRRLAK